MLSKKILQLICLLISLSIAISAFGGCKPKQEEANNSSSGISASSDENESQSEDESFDDTASDDTVSDDEYFDDNYEYDDGFLNDTFTDSDVTDDLSSNELVDDPYSSDDELVSSSDDYEYDEELYLYDELHIKNSEENVINNNFRGVNMVHMLFGRMPDKYGRVYNQKQLDLEYDTLSKLRVKKIRSFYGSSLSWNKKTKTHEFTEDNAYLEGFIQSCLDMQELGIEVGISPTWQLLFLFVKQTMPSEPTVNLIADANVVYTDDTKTKVDVDASAKKFSEFVRDSVTYFEARGIKNIKEMFCFTECNNALYNQQQYLTGKETSMKEKRHYELITPVFDKMIRAVDKGLKDAGLRKQYKIVAPCDNWRYDYDSYFEGYSTLVKYCVDNLSDYVDVIGSHNGYAVFDDYLNEEYYNHPQASNATSMMEAKLAGKEFWVDEYNVNLLHVKSAEESRESKKNPMMGLATGVAVSGILNSGDISNVYIWTLYDQQWPDKVGTTTEFLNGVQIVGAIPCYLESTTPRPNYYALSLLAKYIGQGKVFATDIGFSVYLSAVERDDGELTVLVVNYNFTDTPVKIVFDEKLNNETFYRYVYNPSEIIPASGNEMVKCSSVIKNVEHGFTDVLMGATVSIYTTEKPE